MNPLLEWLAKILGQVPVEGAEALMVKGLRAALILLVVYAGSKILLKGIERHLRKSDQRNDAAIKTFKKVVHFSLWMLGILIALHAAGIDMSSFFTTGGLLAVALGLALKNVAENYVGGLVIKANDSIKPGDVLDVDGLMVKVKNIGVRDTIVRTKDEVDILIPNALLVQGKIGNYTLRDSISRLWTSIGVSYSSDLKKARDVLENVCRQFNSRVAQQEPVVLLTEFGESSVNYQVFIWIDDPWQIRVIKSQLNETIWWGLKDAGIEIPFPQLDVHIEKRMDGTVA